MTPVPTRDLPYAEEVAIDYLLSDPDLDALVGDRIASEPYEAEAVPFLVVRKIAGTTNSYHWIDRPMLQVEGWASERDTAWEVCETAVRVLHDMPGNATLAVVTAVEDVTGPRSLPDPETSTPRFIAEVLVTEHPLFDFGS